MRQLTSSSSTFEDFIVGQFLYVDKTEYLWRLLQPYTASYFLARPRRFGKSLTLSTLKAIFEGKRELFEGLAISRLDYDWKPYPVLHFDFSTCNAHTIQEFKQYLSRLIKRQCSLHNVSVEISSDLPAASFEDLISAVAGEGKAVILIDEYDKVILDNIDSQEAPELLNELKTFYSAIKSCNSKERFVFVTGVTKFSHVSLFSGFNNLTDLTMRADCAGMLGYTQQEVETCFADYIQQGCTKTGADKDAFLSEIKQWYDGYRFEVYAESVYNPVSLTKFFENGCEFQNYWFATGTPSFLVKLIREQNFDLGRILSGSVSALAFDAFELDHIELTALLFQTGYLTIKGSSTAEGIVEYFLDFPNREVKGAFETYLISDYAGLGRAVVDSLLLQLLKAIRRADVEQFMELLKTFFAGMSYDVGGKVEGRYQIIFATLFSLLGIYFEAESRTNNGRIDAVLCNENNVFLFEFKIDQSAQVALTQIQYKDYTRKYCHRGRKIFLIGANFDTETRQLADWKIQVL